MILFTIRYAYSYCETKGIGYLNYNSASDNEYDFDAYEQKLYLQRYDFLVDQMRRECYDKPYKAVRIEYEI
ncbi:hypothetical protein [Stenotrophomonas phage RAS14]